MKNDFVHLHVHSTYSLLDSVAAIPKLVRRAKELGMPALALTDHGNMLGIKEFYDACVSTRGEQAIKPILGCEVFVTSSGDHTRRDKNEKRYHLWTPWSPMVRLASRSATMPFCASTRVSTASICREKISCQKKMGHPLQGISTHKSGTAATSGRASSAAWSAGLPAMPWRLRTIAIRSWCLRRRWLRSRW